MISLNSSDSICKTSRFKIKMYKLLLDLHRSIGLEYLTITTKLYSSDLLFYIPTRFNERILDNFEHVLVNCDYYRVSNFIPSRGDTIVDLGAFIGFYSITSSILTRNDSRVYSIEPNTEVLPWLYRNVHINKTWNIKILPVAICPEPGLKTMYIASYPAVSSLNREYVEYFDNIVKTIEVKCVKLSNLLKRLGYVDILKMDIEGSELSVLKESASELWRVQRIVAEIHSNIIDSFEIEQNLVRAGFTKIITYVSNEMPYQKILYGLR